MSSLHGSMEDLLSLENDAAVDDGHSDGASEGLSTGTGVGGLTNTSHHKVILQWQEESMHSLQFPKNLASSVVDSVRQFHKLNF